MCGFVALEFCGFSGSDSVCVCAAVLFITLPCIFILVGKLDDQKLSRLLHRVKLKFYERTAIQ